MDTLLYVIYMYTAISRKVVGHVNATIPKGIAGGVEFTEHSSKKFERMARETMDICLPVLKESNKSRFSNCSHQEQCIDHIPYYLFGIVTSHFLDNLSQNSGMYLNKK